MDAPTGHSQLERVISAHLADWDTPHVELSIYGHANAALIAATLDDFCREQLGAPVSEPLFYESSMGAVAGVVLNDGRRVVIKGHQPQHSFERLAEIVRLRGHLVSKTGLPPIVRGGPARIGNGWGIVEDYIDLGAPADGHNPDIIVALAESLCRICGALEPFVQSSSLDPEVGLPKGTLWPTPHSKLFDFEATRLGAQDIDTVASAARQQMQPCDRLVIGHGDWRVEHVRFEGTRVVAALDWDGLSKVAEAELVGFTASAFCADWNRTNYAQAPTLEEARAFVLAYETARGRHFSASERKLCGARFAYGVAYTSRCTHSLGRSERDKQGTFQHLVATYGIELLNL